MRHLAVLTALLVSACSHRVYSPPAQAFALSSVEALPHGDRALDVEVSTHSQIFDPPLRAGTGRYRAGLGENAEATVEGTAMSIGTSGTSMANRSIYGTRAGVSVNPGKNILSFSAGGGGGYAPAGGFFASVDGGVSLGIENCYLVPILAATAFASQPLNARPIDVSDGNGTRFDTPRTTVGSTVRGGLRVALRPSACARGENVPWIYAGFGMTAVADRDSQDELFGGGLGVQIPL